MPKTQISCPRCRTPMTAEIQQLFDMNTDPQAKQKLLNGSANSIQCASCGFEGIYPTPVIYHDPDKQMLLTFFPPELGLPVNEQERMVGPLINRVVNDLPMEKRKAYLFQAKNMLTYQTLMETILAADGVTKEMLDQQQKKLQLIQRLLSTPAEDSRKEIMHQEESLMDEAFFGLLNRLVEATLMQGDQDSAQKLAVFQQELLQETEVGRQIQEQMKESQQAMDDLQAVAKEGLTREKLLDLFIDAPGDLYKSTLVGMTRSGLDYDFFQILSGRIEQSNDSSQTVVLTDLRDFLLDATKKIDEQIKQEMQGARKVLDSILAAPSIEEGLKKYGNQVNEFFVEAVQTALEEARKESNLEKLAKLNQLNTIIEESSKPPAAIQFIEELLKSTDDDALNALLQQNLELLDDEFMQTISGIVVQSEQQGQQPELVDRLKVIQKFATRAIMKKNLQG
jgi:hypothetical protein